MKGFVILGIFLSAGLCGCTTSPLRKAYVDHSAAMPESARKELRPVKAEAVKVQWVEARHYGREMERRMNEDFTFLGEAGFNGEMPSNRELVRQAQRVGADSVLFTTKSVGSEERAAPLRERDYPNFVQSKRFGSPRWGKDAGVPMGSGYQETTRTTIFDFEVSFWRTGSTR